MNNNFKEVIEKIGSDVLTDDSKKMIVESFENTVKARVDERIQLEKDELVKKIDEDHSQKLQKLLEAIDTDHTAKLQKVVAKIDEDHTAKLQEVINKYETLLKEEAVKLRDSLVTELSNFIDLYIDKTIPKAKIEEACVNTQAKNILDEMKKLLAVDEEYVNDNIKQALVDGKTIIDGLRKELNEAVQENVKINKELSTQKAELVLEKKTSPFIGKKREYVMRVLRGKSPEYVNENFSHVVEMFEKSEKEQVEILKESATKESVSSKLDLPKSESTSIGQRDGHMGDYVAHMERLDGTK